MESPIQWTVDQLFASLTAIQSGAEAERARASMNNQRLIDLNAQVDRLLDPAKKATMKAWIATSVQEQVRIATNYRTFVKRFSDAAGKVKDWLKSLGMNPSVPGLGNPLIVAAAIVAAVVAVKALLDYLKSRNDRQTTAIKAHQDVFDRYAAMSSTPAELNAAIQAANGAIDASNPKTPDPFTNLADALPWLFGIVAVLFVARPLLQSFAPRRIARSAA